MAIKIDDIKEKIKNRLSDEKFLKKLIFGLSIAAIIILFAIFFIRSASKIEYGVLYTHLSPDDAGEILSVLQEEKVPYKIEGDGSIILIPQEKVYEIRLKLASKGVPSSNVVGLEIFSEPKMGTTHFQENVNYIRAIEGELIRTITKLDAVKSAKVNIALPQRSVFAREEEKAKASVIISLWAGKTLTKEQVKSIIFLVSHSVAKLNPQDVTVVDNSGRVLSEWLEDKEEKVKDNIELKRKIEKSIERRVESMLAQAIGPRKVVVRASVEIETARVRQKDEIYNPEKTAVVSERKIQEKEKAYKPREQSGSPGTPTNVPPVIDLKNIKNLTKDKNKKDVTTNYDVTKSLIDTQKNIFKIKRITVGVLVDGKYRSREENGTIIKEYIARSKEELASYERLIKSAIGFDEKRGDKISVVSVQFETTKLRIPKEKKEYSKEEIIFFISLGVIIFLLLGGFGWFVRKTKKEKEEQKKIEELKRIEAIEAAREAKKKEEEELSLNLSEEPAYTRILEMVEDNPELITNMISKWLKEEGK